MSILPRLPPLGGGSQRPPGQSDRQAARRSDREGREEAEAHAGFHLAQMFLRPHRPVLERMLADPSWPPEIRELVWCALIVANHQFKSSAAPNAAPITNADNREPRP